MPHCPCQSNPDIIHVRYSGLSRKATALVIAQCDLDTLAARMEHLIAGIEAGQTAADLAGEIAASRDALTLVADRANGNQARQAPVI